MKPAAPVTSIGVAGITGIAGVLLRQSAGPVPPTSTMTYLARGAAPGGGPIERPGRIADNDCTGWHIAHNHRAHADQCALSHCNAGAQHCAGTDISLCPDDNAAGQRSSRRNSGTGTEHALMANHRQVADPDMRADLDLTRKGAARPDA